MAAAPGGTATYKKKDGYLTLSSDRKSVIWGPQGADPTVTHAVSNITNLQQTPATSAKVVLRIKTKSGPPLDFQFTSPDARTEADAVKMELSQLLANTKDGDLSFPKPTMAPTPANSNSADPSGSAPTSALVTTTSSAYTFRPLDDNSLKHDIELQQSLMKNDAVLHDLYMEGRAAKADNISDSAWNTMFWSQRTHLLRAHAVETGQKKGFINILSVVKTRTVDNDLRVSMSVEQMQQIFQQHPLIRKVYDELVPKKLPPDRFWSQFFLSKLYHHIRGERDASSARANPDFDRYINADNETGVPNIIGQGRVPFSIDVGGNEEDQGGFKGGNRPHNELRPRKSVMIKTLNSISSKIMAKVGPSDPMTFDDLPAPEAAAETSEEKQTGDEALKGELVLLDLITHKAPTTIPLDIKDRDAVDSGSKRNGNSSLDDDDVLHGKTPQEMLDFMRADLEAVATGKVDIHSLIGINDESGSDSDGDDGDQQQLSKGKKHKAPKDPIPRVGSKRARQTAQDSILNAVLATRINDYGSQDPAVTAHRLAISSSSTSAAATTSAEDLKAEKRARARIIESTAILTPGLAEKCRITHAATLEFLSQFRSAFHSGDPDRALELEGLAQSLRNSRERIKTLAQDAEVERLTAYEIEKNKARQLYRATGQKVLPKKDGCPGGSEAVMGRFAVLLGSLEGTLKAYADALEKEGIRGTVEGGDVGTAGS